jgi:hypothetical protein
VPEHLPQTHRSVGARLEVAVVVDLEAVVRCPSSAEPANVAFLPSPLLSYIWGAVNALAGRAHNTRAT